MRKGVENTHVASGRVRWYGLIGRELGYIIKIPMPQIPDH